jgi:hypothetical protein
MDPETPSLPTVLLGSRIAEELLGPGALDELRTHPDRDSAHGQLAHLIVHSAAALDMRDLTFLQVARAAAGALSTFGTDREQPTGSTSGVATARLEYLAGAREQSREHLCLLIGAYKNCSPPDPGSPSPEARRQRDTALDRPVVSIASARASAAQRRSTDTPPHRPTATAATATHPQAADHRHAR